MSKEINSHSQFNGKNYPAFENQIAPIKVSDEDFEDALQMLNADFMADSPQLETASQSQEMEMAKIANEFAYNQRRFWNSDKRYGIGD